jgi:hypothetical protein
VAWAWHYDGIREQADALRHRAAEHSPAGEATTWGTRGSHPRRLDRRDAGLATNSRDVAFGDSVFTAGLLAGGLGVCWATSCHLGSCGVIAASELPLPRALRG